MAKLIDTSALEEALDSLDQRISDFDPERVAEFIANVEDHESRLDSLENRDNSDRRGNDLGDRVAGLEDKVEELDLDSVTSRMDDLEQALEEKAETNDIPDFDDMESRLRDVEDKVEDLPDSSSVDSRLDDLEEDVQTLKNAPARERDDQAAADLKELTLRVEELFTDLGVAQAKIQNLETKTSKSTSFFEHLRRAAEILLDR